MKNKYVSLLLALVLVLSMVPVQVLAADSGITVYTGLSPEFAVAGLVSRPPETPVPIADEKNKVTVYATEGGTVTAELREEDDWDTYAAITAIPDKGYVVYGLVVENANGETSSIRYKGNHVFDVELIYDTATYIYVYFSKPAGKQHNVRVDVTNVAGGSCTVSRTKAYAGEQVFVDLQMANHYSRAYVDFEPSVHTSVYSHKYSEKRYEMLMPDCDVTIEIRFLKDQAVYLSCYSYGGGTITLNRTSGYPGDTFRCQILPRDGYRIDYIYAEDQHGPVTLKYVGSNSWEGVIAQDAGHVGIDVTFEWSENPFLDVPDDAFYYDSVIWAQEQGITTGTDMSHFDPNGQCLRAQVVTFLWRAEGRPEPTTTKNPFVDVKKSDWYYKAVLWAVEEGITTGTDATHFNPMGVCNRAQVVTFLWRAWDCPEPYMPDQAFTDVPANAWYAKPVAWAVEYGITNGMTETKFGPSSPCNRAQVVTFLYRAY